MGKGSGGAQDKQSSSPMGGHTGGTKRLLEVTAGPEAGRCKCVGSKGKVWGVSPKGWGGTKLSSLSCTQRELTLMENVPMTITKHHRVAKYLLIPPFPSLQALAIF